MGHAIANRRTFTQVMQSQDRIHGVDRHGGFRPRAWVRLGFATKGPVLSDVTVEETAFVNVRRRGGTPLKVYDSRATHAEGIDYGTVVDPALAEAPGTYDPWYSPPSSRATTTRATARPRRRPRAPGGSGHRRLDVDTSWDLRTEPPVSSAAARWLLPIEATLDTPALPHRM